MAKTKIVVLTHTMPRFAGDSAAAFMTGLGNGLVAAGLDVTFLAPWHPKFTKNLSGYTSEVIPVNHEQKFRTVTYHYFPIHSLETFGYSAALEGDMNIRPWQMVLAPFVIIFGALALIRLIKREKIEVVSAHWLVPNGLIAAIARLATHVTTHVSLPGSDVFLAQRNPIVKPCAVWAAKHTNLITSNSPALANDLRRLGVKKKIVPVIYGVDPVDFKPVKSVQYFNDTNRRSKCIVLGVGRLVRKKGFHLLLGAFAQLSNPTSQVDLRGRKLQLILVGDGAERGTLENQARALRIADRVTFAGTASPATLRQHYQKADIFVLPSIRDERGNLDDQSVSVIEAMASSLPVITTDLPGYRLTIDHGKTGFLFKEGNVDELARYLKKLLADPKLRRQIGRSAQKVVERQFSWNAIGRQYHALFEKMVA